MGETKETDQYKGWLYKWTNYLRGYQKRWFVVQNGLLSYYRNQAEMAHTCRGTINLATATIESYDSHTIVISNGGTQTYHLRTSSEVEKKKWVTALILSKSKSISLSQVDDPDDDSGFLEKTDREVEVTNFLQKMAAQLHDLQTCQQLVKRQGDQLVKALCEIETLAPVSSSHDLTTNNAPPWGAPAPTPGYTAAQSPVSFHLSDQGETTALSPTSATKLPGGAVQVNVHPASDTVPDIPPHLEAPTSVVHNASNHHKSASYGGNVTNRYKTINEKATVFKVAVSAMVNACSEFEAYVSTHGKRWQRLLIHEREQKARLEKMVEELAKQLSAFEKRLQSAGAHSPYSTGNSTTATSPHRTDDSTRKSPGAPPGGQVIYLPGHSSTRSGSLEERADSEDDDFFDAVDNIDEEHEAFCVSIPSSPADPHYNASLQTEEIYSPDEYESGTESDWENRSASCRTEVRVVSRKKGAAGRLDNRASSSSQKSKGHRRTASSEKTVIGQEEVHEQGSGTPRRSHSAGKQAVVKPSLYAEEFMRGVKPRQRRDCIPFRPNISLNLWGIIKNCIGKDLSKIPVPVNFNEPLSMLQRLTEDLEYSKCLDSASQCSDSIEQMAYVAAFTVSSYSTTTTRTGKPFNPLLGETFECDRRDDMGWRSVAEQVSHHPPAAAIHAQSSSWECSQEFTMSSKFRGKYIAIIPLGIAHLKFFDSGNHYTWRKVTSTVHNIIVGKLWIDNHGEMDIYNHKTGDVCHLNYKAYSYFSRDTPRRVTGVITDKSGKARYVLNGTWDEYMEGAHITTIKQSSGGQPIFETGPTTLLWRRNPAPPNSDRMYNLTKFAVELNEAEEGVAPTDCRLRPDQKLMEDGRWDEANREKERLEEKQRSKRRLKEKLAEDAKREGTEPPKEWQPVWFNTEIDETTGSSIHVFNNQYWNCKETQNWTNCPDIF